MLWAISGGAGFLGLHLARRLLADGHAVRTLDLAPLDDAELERDVEELRGDVRDPATSRRARRAAPTSSSTRRRRCRSRLAREIRSVNVGGTRRSSRPRAKPACAARSSSPRRPSTASPRCTRSTRTPRSSASAPTASRRSRRSASAASSRPAGSRSRSSARRRSSARTAGRLRDPLRLDPRRAAHPHPRRRAQPLPAARRRGPRRGGRPLRAARGVAGETLNVGATEFGTVRADLQALIDHAGSASRLTPVPARPAEVALRGLELARLSPLAEWHYKTAHRDSFVDVAKAERLLGWQPRLSNAEALCRDLRLVPRATAARSHAPARRTASLEPAGARLLKRLS